VEIKARKAAASLKKKGLVELSLPELLDLVRCPLTAEGFIELLKGRGRLD